MNTIQALYAFVTAHWLAISGGLLGLLSVASTIANVFRDPDNNPETPPPKWVQIVDALSWLAAKGHVSLGNTRVSLPGMRSRKAKAPGAAGRLPLPAIAFALLASHLVACGFCQHPENHDTARCVAERTSLDCGAPEVIKVVTDIAASVAAALASGDYSTLLDAIVTDLQHRGLSDAWGLITCTIDHIMSKAGFSISDTSMTSNARAWMAEHPAKVKAAK